jgi:hypothetical protein
MTRKEAYIRLAKAQERYNTWVKLDQTNNGELVAKRLEEATVALRAAYKAYNQVKGA